MFKYDGVCTTHRHERKTNGKFGSSPDRCMGDRIILIILEADNHNITLICCCCIRRIVTSDVSVTVQPGRCKNNLSKSCHLGTSQDLGIPVRPKWLSLGVKSCTSIIITQHQEQIFVLPQYNTLPDRVTKRQLCVTWQ